MTSEVGAGLVIGVIAAVATAAFALLVIARGTRGGSVHHIAGAPVVAASLIALAGQRSVPAALIVAIVGIGGICMIPPPKIAASLATLLALPFAVLLVSDLDVRPRGLALLVVVVASVGPIAAARTETVWGCAAVTPALLAVTAAAVLFAVPDTEEVAVLFGAALPMGVLGWPVGLVSLGRAGAGAATVLVVWTVATGGRASTASTVGALACLGLLTGLSVGRRLAGDPTTDRATDPTKGRMRVDPNMLPAVVVGVHTAVAFVAARAGAAHAGLSRAVIVALVTTTVSVGAGARLPSPADD